MNPQPGKAYIAAAKRTAVVPRHGGFARIEAAELAACVIQALIAEVNIPDLAVDHVLLGNALYGGGNPARVAALAAGLDAHVPAMTIDSQCCAGLDAIALGASIIAAGQADIIIAGGVESYSRSPIRMRRPSGVGETAVAYDRPPFTPWLDADPGMIEAAGALAYELEISRERQEALAIASHDKARASAAAMAAGEIVPVESISNDAFTRQLTPATCARLPVLAGTGEYGLTPATVAVEADAAATVLLVSERFAGSRISASRPVQVCAFKSVGGDPVRPGLAPVRAAQYLLQQIGISAGDIAVVEIMEAFAAQAIAFTDALEFPDGIVNPGGGGLARGHPIGASGAILAVRMFHELQSCRPGARGLAAIAAAGGLGSAALFAI